MCAHHVHSVDSPQSENIPINLRPNGVIWDAQNSNESLVVGRESVDDASFTTFRWKHVFVEWIPEEQRLPPRTSEDYLKLHFPMQILSDLVRCTNHNVRTNHVGHHAPTFTESDVWKHLGLRLTMSLSPLPCVDDYWKKESEDSVLPAHEFGKRFGISKHFFECFEECLQWSDRPEVSL